MAQTFRRNRFTWVAYLLLAVYGFFLNNLGPITPFLKDELVLTYTVSSLHFTAFAAGILLAGLGSAPVVGRIGRMAALWGGAAGLTLGAVLLMAGRSPVVTIGAAFVAGVLGSLILAVVPGALSDQHGEARAVAMSEANVVASLFSAAAPLLVGWFARNLGEWRWVLVVAAVLPPLTWLSLGRSGAGGSSAAAPRAPEGARGRLPGRYWIYWVALVLSIAIEFCMVTWSADYAERVLGLPRASAAQSVSVFLGAMIVGRWASSRLVRRFSAAAVVTASIGLASAGFLVFWLAWSTASGLVGLFLTGLGVAGLYPLLISLAIASAGEMTVQASGRATLASGVAILTLPLALGRLADLAGIRPAYAVVLLLLAGVFVVSQVAGRRERVASIA